MIPLPDWAPSIHPFAVHFPIALLCAAALVDGAALVIRRDAVRAAATILYVLGGATVVLAFFSGRNGAESLLVSGIADSLLTEHADWALKTVWFFGVYGLLRAALGLMKRDDKSAVRIPLALVGVGGLFLLYETGEHGAQLVFEHGVGVQAVNVVSAPPPESVGGGLVIETGGSWHWLPGPNAETIASGFLRWDGDERPRAQFDSTDGAIILQVGAEGLLTFGPALGNVEVSAEVKTAAFNGDVALVHHSNSSGYDFLAIGVGGATLGRIADGRPTNFDTEAVADSGWVSLRAVGDGTHFRGYINDRLVVHGHGNAAPAGATGIRLGGTGVLRIRRLSVRPL